jgi:hypothetical protein
MSIENLEEFLLFETSKVKPKQIEIKELEKKIEKLDIISGRSKESIINDVELELKQCKEQYSTIEKFYEERKMKLESNIDSLTSRLRKLKENKSKDLYDATIEKQKSKDLLRELKKHFDVLEKERDERIQKIDFDKLGFDDEDFTFYYDCKEYKVKPSYKYKSGKNIRDSVIKLHPGTPIDVFVKSKDIKLSRGKKSKKRKREWELERKKKKRKK